MPLNCGWPIDEIIVIIVCCHTGTYDYREMTSDRFMFLMTAVVMGPLGSPFLSAPPHSTTLPPAAQAPTATTPTTSAKRGRRARRARQPTATTTASSHRSATHSASLGGLTLQRLQTHRDHPVNKALHFSPILDLCRTKH